MGATRGQRDYKTSQMVGQNEFKDRFIYEAALVEVIDGETIDVNVYLGFQRPHGKIFHEIRLRLQGIDTPEVRGVEKVAGKVSKEALEELLGWQNLNPEKRLLFIETKKTSKYGLYIAVIWMPVKWINNDILDGSYVETFNNEEWLNVNEYMVFHRFAKHYS